MTDFPPSSAVEDLFKEVDALLLEPEDNWKHVGDVSDFRVVRKKHKKHSPEISKVTGILKFPVGEVVKVMDDLSSRHVWDEMCKSASLVKQEGDVQIHHLQLAPMPLISARDIVYYTANRFDGKTCVSRSLPNSERLINPAKNVVRMEIILSGSKLESCIEDGKESTKVTFLGLSDPKGMVPNLNLKAVALKSASLLCNMRDYLCKTQQTA